MRTLLSALCAALLVLALAAPGMAASSQTNADLEKVLARLDDMDKLVVDLQTALTSARAVGPENGGHGEADKARLIEEYLKGIGVTDIVRVDAGDDRVPAGYRPNLVAFMKGRTSQNLCLVAHMDVVPEGDLSLWKTDPWQVVREGDTLYGRGVEDNQQSLVSMLLLARALADERVQPELGLKMVFVSDEECTNDKGINHLLAERLDLFPKDDLYIVPDSGAPAGDEIEIAEKHTLHLKITVNGRQSHASIPDKGVNSLAAMGRVLVALEGLRDMYPQQDSLFAPPYSTFTPTRHDQNVEADNILPGRDVFYLDCRLLPEVSPEEVQAKVAELAQKAAAPLGATVEVSMETLERASRISPETPVVKALAQAVEARGITPRLIGVGGSTVAASLRHKGLEACVWSTIAECAHEPNEHGSIRATIEDAKTFARMIMDGGTKR